MLKEIRKNNAQLESMGVKVIVVCGCVKKMMKGKCVLLKK